MSIRDSKFTNPDSLRAQYQQPRNPLQELDETFSDAQRLAQTGTQPGITLAGGTGSGGSGHVPGGGAYSGAPGKYKEQPLGGDEFPHLQE